MFARMKCIKDSNKNNNWPLASRKLNEAALTAEYALVKNRKECENNAKNSAFAKVGAKKVMRKK